MSEAHNARATAAALRLVELYQAARAGRPTACRFHPSCSAYAHEAIAAHGALRGSALAARRLLRCRPLGPHGIDEVPPGRVGAAR